MRWDFSDVVFEQTHHDLPTPQEQLVAPDDLSGPQLRSGGRTTLPPASNHSDVVQPSQSCCMLHYGRKKNLEKELYRDSVGCDGR